MYHSRAETGKNEKKKKKKPKEISLNEFAMQDSKGNTNWM